MIRITVEITDETQRYLALQKHQHGSSISFEANALIEQSIRERNRKKKLPLQDGSKENNS